ncbi:MAG: threonine--tRNA ligase, partial [Legionellales bacterium]
ELIEKKMLEIAKSNLAIIREEMSRAAAIKLFSDMGETYKVKIIEDIPSDQTLSLYRQGDFIDLCRGPHLPNTSFISAFKLTKVAGAYWRGDANNAVLQRIYGTAWANKKDLQQYLERIAEAEKRDHRKLAKKLDLFHIQEESPGMIFWHPNGWTIYIAMQNYMRAKLDSHGYVEVNTPQLVDRSLWEKSGHWEKFGDDMFTLQADARDYAIKPMNCPCHVQIFKQGLKSYRDLPLRMAEFGSCHRNECSGSLHGLLRVRNFVQDDAHIFCTENQLQGEVAAFIKLLYEVYADFGFTEVSLRLSTRPEKRVGSDAIWDKAELALQTALEQAELEFDICPGEGAFYGPKIEFSLTDCIGRVWQCGTMQVDFSIPERLGASYVAEDGSKKTPVMLHRAVLGTFERFMGILLENTAGDLPIWLAPKQVVVLCISAAQQEYCTKIVGILAAQGFRVLQDLRNEKIGFKIREHTMARVPFLLVVGDKEVAANAVNVRTRTGVNLGTKTIDDFTAMLSTVVAEREFSV